MKSFRSVLSVAASAAAMGCGLFAGPASAQDAAATTSEDIVVTGSSIRGVVPVGSTVTTVGREDFAQSSAVSSAEIFRSIPQVEYTGINETNRGAQGGGSNVSYANAINLRGLAPTATLTLMNGHRLPPAGTNGQLVDPSVVPLLALERVEVLADGASAVYGSDAIAGVVNLIMRRNLDGVEAIARQGFADDYSTRQLGVAFGKVWDSGQFMLAFDHSYHSELNGRDRDFISSDLRARGGGDYRSVSCNPGNIVVGGVSYAIPAGGVTPANASALQPGTINRCNLGPVTDVIPEIEKNAFIGNFRQDLAPGVTLFGDGYYYERTFGRLLASPAQPLSVPSTNAFFVAPPGTNPTTETVQYSFARDFGDGLRADGYGKSHQFTLGADIDLSSSWTLTTSASYGVSEDFALNYNVNPTALATALASSNPATAFNPFGGVNSPTVIAAVGNYASLHQTGETKALQLIAKADGTVFTLPGGDVRLAAGVEYNEFDLLFVNRAGPVGQEALLAGSPAPRSRTWKSAFAELLVPIVGPENAMPGVQELSINLAGRYDEYSDVGETTNPKIGVNWVPFDGLKLRGNWGTAFRAPPTTQIMLPTSYIIVQNFSDPTSPTGVTTGYMWNEGNPNLQPEEAESWSLGFDLTPDLVPGLSLTATYFNTTIEGQITTLLGDLTVLQREALYPGQIIRNPSPAFVQSLANRLLVVGGFIPNPAVVVDVRPANLGVTNVDGVDFNANYQFDTESAGTFGLGLNGIWYANYDVAQSATAPSIERAGFINFPTEYRLRGTASWEMDRFKAAAFVNYVPSYSNNSVNPIQEIKAWTTLDLALSYDLPVGGEGGLFRALTLSLNVQNLFDRDPPFANLAGGPLQSGGFDVQQSNPLGRLITAGASVKF